MTSRVEIIDTPRHASLTIEPTSDEQAEITLQVESDLIARQLVDFSASDYRELKGFVDEVAAEWRGWAGSKRWHLPDERCSLDARHDGTGHVLITARLLPLHYQLDWQVAATLIFEAGQLDKLASVIADAA